MKSLMAFFLLFLIAETSHTAFVDQFTRRNEPLQNSFDILNSQMILKIQQALEAANFQDAKCNEKQESLLNESQSVLFRALRNELLNMPIDDYAESTKSVQRRQIRFEDSIYKGLYSPQWINNWAGQKLETEPVINIADHLITIQKLARFVGDGYSLYQNHVKKSYTTEQTENKSFEDSKKFLETTGALSYAEHSAKIAGFGFWKDLCGDSSKADHCLPGKLISCDKSNGKWILGKSFDFKDYVDDSWDEAINCSMYAADFSLATTKKIQKLTGDKQLPCPVDPSLCLDLSKSSSKKFLSPICSETAERLKKGLMPGLFTDYMYKPKKHDPVKPSAARK